MNMFTISFLSTLYLLEEIVDTASPVECNSINSNKKDGGKKIQSTRKCSPIETTSKEPVIIDLMNTFFKQHYESISIFADKFDRRDAHSENKKPEAVDKMKLVLEAFSKIYTH